MGNGLIWFDAGSPDSLLEASNYVHAIEKRKGLKIACLEQIAYNKKLITKDDLKKIIKSMPESEYGKYLLKSINNEAD